MTRSRYRYEEELENLQQAGTLMGLAIMALYGCHVIACVWYYIGVVGTKVREERNREGPCQGAASVQWLPTVGPACWPSCPYGRGWR